MGTFQRQLIAWMAGVFAAVTGHAAEPVTLAALPADLTQLSLNELLSIEVSSVSKRIEPLAQAAAAIFVLTGEEIRRSGVHSIAEALRMVPGLQVARTDALGYEVTSRGMGDDLLEVRLDGRSVYSPFTSSVFWDTLDVDLGDIERIEVIRGPGAALWGANAVNGVINIITKASSETQRTEVHAGAGNEERAFASARTGVRVGAIGDARFYAQARSRDGSKRDDGSDADDGGNIARTGFRSDLLIGRGHDRAPDRLLLEGDYYHGDFHGASPYGGYSPLDVGGADVVGRWTRTLASGSELAVQAYYDHTLRDFHEIYREARDTLDVDAHHTLRVGDRHQLIYGIGFRGTHDRFGEAPEYSVVVDPSSRTNQTWSAFIQDEIALVPESTTLTIGSRFEHNDITGFEFEPNARLGWQVGERVFTWASVARAVRMPNRYDTSIALYCPPPDGIPDTCGPGLLPLGNPRINSENVIAYEWGLRFWSAHDFSADVALFYNDYRRLVSQETVLPLFDNKLAARSVGGELSLTWKPTRSLDVRASYNELHIRARTTGDGTDTPDADYMGDGWPKHQAGLRVGWMPAPKWTLDGFLRYVGAQEAIGIPSYTELNLRAAWRVRPSLELAVVGENLLHARHAEDASAINVNDLSAFAQLERSLTVELTWSWQ